MQALLKLMEYLWPPDAWLRAGIRGLNRRKLAELEGASPEEEQARFMDFVRELSQSPLALCTEEANRQHYELPPAFFEAILGPALKYSCAYWPEGVYDLAGAERAMLDLYAQRAQLEDGQDILELGCGWGSLSLYLARRYPRSRILGVSNSHSQRLFITQRAAQEGLSNLTILTCDVNRLTLDGDRYDRILSIEMLEHVRNYPQVFALLGEALRPGGKLFVHVFCHARHAYGFDVRRPQDWMERYFFSGGVMPSRDLFLYFSSGLALEDHWVVSGLHYQRTAEAWLENMRARRAAVAPVLQEVYGRTRRRWWVYWQLFFLACAELFGTDRGRQWMVTHYLWRRPEVNLTPTQDL